MKETNKNKVGVCPYCRHQWTYKERLLGYVIKPRSRTKCPNCGEYLEPSLMTTIYEYFALILTLLLVVFIIPQTMWMNSTKILTTGLLLIVLIFVFIPLTVRFERITYSMKSKKNR